LIANNINRILALAHKRIPLFYHIRNLSQVYNSHFFSGAPKRIVPDNLKTGVIKADLYDPKFNQGYEELAHHYGIVISWLRRRLWLYLRQCRGYKVPKMMYTISLRH